MLSDKPAHAIFVQIIPARKESAALFRGQPLGFSQPFFAIKLSDSLPFFFVKRSFIMAPTTMIQSSQMQDSTALLLAGLLQKAQQQPDRMAPSVAQQLAATNNPSHPNHLQHILQSFNLQQQQQAHNAGLSQLFPGLVQASSNSQAGAANSALLEMQRRLEQERAIQELTQFFSGNRPAAPISLPSQQHPAPKTSGKTSPVQVTSRETSPVSTSAKSTPETPKQLPPQDPSAKRVSPVDSVLSDTHKKESQGKATTTKAAHKKKTARATSPAAKKKAPAKKAASTATAHVKSAAAARKRFPIQLHKMMEDIQHTPENAKIIAYTESGRAFKIYSCQAFEKEILPQYFDFKIRTFKKQLKLYGFDAIKGGPEAGAYQHPLFRRNDAKFYKRIRRCPVATAAK